MVHVYLELVYFPLFSKRERERRCCYCRLCDLDLAAKTRHCLSRDSAAFVRYSVSRRGRRRRRCRPSGSSRFSLDRIGSDSCHYTLSFDSPYSLTPPTPPHPYSHCITINRLRDQQPSYSFLLFSFFFSSFFSFHTKIIIIIIWMKLSRVSLDCSLLSSPLPSHGVECVFCSTLLSPTFPRHLSHPPTPHHHHQHHHHSRHCCIDDWISTAQQRNSSSSSSSRFSKSN